MREKYRQLHSDWSGPYQLTPLKKSHLLGSSLALPRHPRKSVPIPLLANSRKLRGPCPEATQCLPTSRSNLSQPTSSPGYRCLSLFVSQDRATWTLIHLTRAQWQFGPPRPWLPTTTQYYSVVTLVCGHLWELKPPPNLGTKSQEITESRSHWQHQPGVAASAGTGGHPVVGGRLWGRLDHGGNVGRKGEWGAGAPFPHLHCILPSIHGTRLSFFKPQTSSHH